MRFILISTLLCISYNVCADTQTDIEQIVLENLRFTESEDVKNGMKTIHPDSPIYPTQEKALVYIAEKYDLNYKLLSFSFIAEHKEYAYARIEFETTRVAGGVFKDNVVDAVWVFRKENETWKYWNQSILTLEYK